MQNLQSVTNLTKVFPVHYFSKRFHLLLLTWIGWKVLFAVSWLFYSRLPSGIASFLGSSLVSSYKEVRGDLSGRPQYLFHVVWVIFVVTSFLSCITTFMAFSQSIVKDLLWFKIIAMVVEVTPFLSLLWLYMQISKTLNISNNISNDTSNNVNGIYTYKSTFLLFTCIYGVGVILFLTAWFASSLQTYIERALESPVKQQLERTKTVSTHFHTEESILDILNQRYPGSQFTNLTFLGIQEVSPACSRKRLDKTKNTWYTFPLMLKYSAVKGTKNLLGRVSTVQGAKPKTFYIGIGEQEVVLLPNNELQYGIKFVETSTLSKQIHDTVPCVSSQVKTQSTVSSKSTVKPKSIYTPSSSYRNYGSSIGNYGSYGSYGNYGSNYGRRSSPSYSNFYY